MMPDPPLAAFQLHASPLAVIPGVRVLVPCHHTGLCWSRTVSFVPVQPCSLGGC